MVLTIKNFESQNVGPGVVETAPTNLVGVAGTLKATLTWTSATGESGVIWSEEKLVRKEGSAPSNSLDGTVVTTITTKDTYATNGYEDTRLNSTKTYYYKVFALYDNGTEKGSTDVNVTPDSRQATTMTIRWQETSNPADFFLEYADDAEGLTQGSTEFDDFFGYSAVRLNASGVETAEVTQVQSGGAGKLDLSRLGNLTIGDNVMIKFPVRGIKMSKSGSTVTLSITKELNKTGYQYYAHQKGTLSNPGNILDNFYIGAYRSSTSNGKMQSLSGVSPDAEGMESGFYNSAVANGTNFLPIGIYQRMYVMALYMMKYGNPNSQEIIGRGRDFYNMGDVTGTTNSEIDATYGVVGGNSDVKLFGVEGLWGFAVEYTGGIESVDATNMVRIGLRSETTPDMYFPSKPVNQTTGSGNVRGICGDNIGMFLTSTGSGNYSDSRRINASRGGRRGYNGNSNLSDNGLFCNQFVTKAVTASGHSRLMYL